MLAYKRIDIAEVCYLDEAVNWIALGRVPEAMPSEGGSEARGDVGDWSNGYSPLGLVPFTESEFVAVGVDVNFDEYLKTRYEDPGFGSFAEFKAHAEQFAGVVERGDLSESQLQSLRLRLSEEDAAKIRHVEVIESAFQPILDHASVKLLGSLMAGEVQASGVRTGPDLDPSGLDFYASRPQEISKRVWTLQGVDIEDRSLICSDHGYCLVTVPTDRLIALHPIPLIQAESVAGLSFGDFLLRNMTDATGADLGDTSITPAVVRSRGRPKKGDGLVEKAVRNHFLQRLKARDLPDKTEAIVQEAIDWALLTLEESISRSAAQRYLRPILEAAPINAAHK